MTNHRGSVALKLVIVLAGSLSVLLVALTLALSSYLTDKLEARALAGLQTTNRQVVDMIDAYNQALKEEILRLNRLFASSFDGDASLGGQTLALGGLAVDRHSVAQPDRFTALTGAYATVLTRRGQDFERTATSIKDADGKRASGVLLGGDHPAVAALLKGETYTGKARMFGRDVMTHYQPIRDRSGQVVGAFFTGIDFSAGLAELRKKVLAVKVGDTGYPYALDAGKDRGLVTLHPKIEGQSLLDAKGARGEEFTKTLLDQKDGVVRYYWQNPGEGRAREKIVVFNHYPEWNWVIASGSYLDEFNAESSAMRHILLTAIAVLIPLIIAGIVFATRRWIARPLGEAVAVAHRVASGDFTGPIMARSGDEIGQLMQAFATMQAELSQLMTAVRHTAEQVHAEAAPLQSAAGNVARSCDEQSDTIAGMAASVEEMSASISLIADSSAQARAVAHDALDQAHASARTIEAAVDAMNRISATVSQTADTVSTLGEHSESISGIAATIKDIADQTNLLALNAAIEAARAGEAGRGFAVVADEVRKLAERTTQSTHQIAELITAIQTATHEAVERMQHGVNEVGQGVQLAAQATESITCIRDGARQVSDAVNSISDAIREQSMASETVAKATEQIVGKIEANSIEAGNTAQSASQLAQMARQLSLSVERFQTA